MSVSPPIAAACVAHTRTLKVIESLHWHTGGGVRLTPRLHFLSQYEIKPLSNSEKTQWLSGMKLVGGVRVQQLSGEEGYWCVCVWTWQKSTETVMCFRVNVSGL